MKPRILLELVNIGYYADHISENSSAEKWDIHNLNIKFHAGERVSFHFYNEEQKHVLWRLFLRKLKPKTGSLIISTKIHIYSDEYLWEGTDKKATILENMNSGIFSKRPWFGGKRKNLETLLDRLNLNTRIKNLPIDQLSREQAIRFWVLLLVSANTKIVLIDHLFSQLDEVSFDFIQEWLASYSGIIVLFGEQKKYFDSVYNLSKNKKLESRNVFRSRLSFSSDGIAKILV